MSRQVGDEPETDGSPDALLSQIVTVFASRLESTTCGHDDDFFVQGGTSFLAAVCVSDLRKKGVLLTLQDLFIAKTPRELAHRIQPLQKVP